MHKIKLNVNDIPFMHHKQSFVVIFNKQAQTQKILNPIINKVIDYCIDGSIKVQREGRWKQYDSF